MGEVAREELVAMTDHELLAYEREHHGDPYMTLAKAKGMQRVALQFWHLGAAKKKADREAQEEGCAAPMPTATPDRRTSRWRRPHHLRHRRQDRLAGLGFGDQATRQLGQVIAVGSRVAAQQREGIVHRQL
jgi:hypothetical protein